MFKDLVDSLNTRLSAPVYSSIFLSAFIINWRPLFYLLFSDSLIESRIFYFDDQTSLISLIVLPIVLGLFLSVIHPWVKLTGSWIAQRPSEITQKLKADTEQRTLEYKQKLLEAAGSIIATEEEQVIEQAKRDAELLSEVSDKKLLEETQKHLRELREERTKKSSAKTSGEAPKNLSPIESSQIAVLEGRIERLNNDIKNGMLSDEDILHNENEIIRTYDAIAKIEGSGINTGQKIGIVISDEIPF